MVLILWLPLVKKRTRMKTLFMWLLVRARVARRPWHGPSTTWPLLLPCSLSYTFSLRSSSFRIHVTSLPIFPCPFYLFILFRLLVFGPGSFDFSFFFFWSLFWFKFVCSCVRKYWVLLGAPGILLVYRILKQNFKNIFKCFLFF